MPYIYGDQSTYEQGDVLHFWNSRWITRGHLAEVTLSPGNAGAFAFNWQNPHANPIIVTRVIVDEQVAGGVAGSLLDIGTAANTGVHGDNLIDGMDANLIGVYDNIDDQGVNGTSKQKVDANGGATDWVTCQIMVANAGALDGVAYIEYIEEV